MRYINLRFTYLLTYYAQQQRVLVTFCYVCTKVTIHTILNSQIIHDSETLEASSVANDRTTQITSCVTLSDTVANLMSYRTEFCSSRYIPQTKSN